MNINFIHNQSAHCESGVASNLLAHHGLKLSEAMIFGIGSGLFFGHIPFLKVNGIPGTTYRILPGMIFKRTCKRLGIQMKRQTFRNEAKAMDELDKVLEKGMPVGLLTSVYYLPYLPSALRFHFNAHNIVVYGKSNGNYLVSDPVMETVSEISSKDLQRARFAKGALAPNGKMYYPIHVPQNIDLRKPIIDGIIKTSSDMTTIPVPLFGVKGERFLAKKIRQYPKNLDKRKAALYLGNIVRMQEEIGTGGAGFRFIFAAFLQEASVILNQEWLMEVSKEVTQTGDCWRNFAYNAARICKDRAITGENYDKLADIIMDCAFREEQIFNKLKKITL
ncbi:MAG: BtrH N-terminal domain-containing protein [Bacteroidetes bacterium]|nr:BtrH N-terminal domain-containing protein [Bacteroidota bacterium]HET6244615.1 BtrH N-terminal domain-containing protein [Bacteroidia bacterium]